MGAIWFRRAQLIGAVADTVGHKAGLTLSRDDLRSHAPESEDWWDGDDEARLRIRSEEFQETLETVLHAVGNIPVQQVSPPGIALYQKYKRRKSKLDLLNRLTDLLKTESAGKGAFDPVSFLIKVATQEGVAGVRMAEEFLEAWQLFLHVNAWSKFRRIGWTNTEQLADLFTSASLDTHYGTFIDQRFLDYLAQNFERIDEVHWRKFEALAAEYFDKAGFRVEMGPGSNDDGVDVRVWPPEALVGAPPAILVQCKRQKEKVEKVVVKALWADVQAEKAESGLIVTTSALAPGARKVCEARQYNVRVADRPALRQWLVALRSPGSGAFLSE